MGKESAKLDRVLQFRLDLHSGVPVYRQLIDQVLLGVASGVLPPGTQLPTVRQMAVDLSINPNTVVRAYRELELRGILTTQQGTGTFISAKEVPQQEALRQQRLDQLVGDLIARAASEGFTADEIRQSLDDLTQR